MAMRRTLIDASPTCGLDVDGVLIVAGDVRRSIALCLRRVACDSARHGEPAALAGRASSDGLYSRTRGRRRSHPHARASSRCPENESQQESAAGPSASLMTGTEPAMTTDWIISADSHVQEPPSLYEERVDA